MSGRAGNRADVLRGMDSTGRASAGCGNVGEELGGKDAFREGGLV